MEGVSAEKKSPDTSFMILNLALGEFQCIDILRSFLCFALRILTAHKFTPD